MTTNLDRLPAEPVGRFTRPLRRFLRIEASAGIALLVCVLVAVALSNSPWSEQYLAFWETPLRLQVGAVELAGSLKQLIDSGLMTVFFFVSALELKRELVLGELKTLRMAALSCSAALGGMLVPAGVFLLLVKGHAGIGGWGSVMATDTAFLIGTLALLGRRVPQTLRLFLLSLAIFDDVGAIFVITVAYGDSVHWFALLLGCAGTASIALLARLGIRNIPVYCAAGAGIWIALDASGIHPTVTGLVLGLMTPARGWVSDSRLRAILRRVTAHPPGKSWSGNTTQRKDLRRASVAAREVLSPLERLELVLHPWVAFAIMPLFALANAGLPFSAVAPIDFILATGIFLGLALGKPVGVIAFGFLAIYLRVADRSPGLSYGLIAAGSVLTGIGFSMGLFIAQVAFDAPLIASAKVGIFAASLFAAVFGLLALLWVTRQSGRSAQRCDKPSGFPLT